MDGTELRIRLLGRFSVEVDGVAVPDGAWRLRKARSLVKLVALAPAHRLHRDVVMEALWPERDARSSSNNLHQALHAARRALGDPGAIALLDDVLVLSPAAWVDVDAFVTAAAAGEVDAALALYDGELLPEDRFEPWAAGRRTALRELQLDLCVRAAEHAASAAHPGEAVTMLAAAAAGAPCHEPVRRALMRALAAAGRHHDALAEFEALREALRAQDGSEPDPETRAMYRELLRAAAPPEEPATMARGVLPHPLTTFVGRARELAELDRLLRRARVVTLTGPGGAGKSRLALEVAARRAEQLPAGAWLVDLAALHDPHLLPQVAATAMGVPIPANRPALDALCARVAALPGALVVLDGCEHLLDGCAQLVEALLTASPHVQVLATSREPLRCSGEVAWRVPSLAEAPELFRERAATVRPPPASGWTDAEAATIDAICWRLERMPLAVELAAAQTSALTVQQIAERLDHALDVLTAGPRTALNRQQTLRATIDWSHELLAGDERVVFRRLAPFAGAFGLEAAEAVVADDALARPRVAALLARLVDQSLVVAERGRFRLPDPIRQFAAERLLAADEDAAARRRHLAWSIAVAQAHDPLAAEADAAPLGELEAIHDDLRGALTFALRTDPAAALALANHLWRFWLSLSLFVEGTQWIEAVLAAAPAPSRPRVEAVLAAASLALRRGDPDTYLARVDEAVALYRTLGDPSARCEALQQHAIFEEYLCSSDRSAALFAEAVETAERLGELRIAASADHASAMTPWSRGDLPAARGRLDAAMARLHELRDGRGRFLQSVTFGMPVLPEGPDGAPRLVWEATVFPFRRLDREGGVALALANVAWVARAAGDVDEAAAALQESLARSRAADDRTAAALGLVHLGHLARSRGEHDAAEAWLREGACRLRELGERRDADVAELGRGHARGHAGDLAGARSALERVLGTFVTTDDLPAMAATRANWAILEERAGELERARELYAGAVDAWRVQRLERFEGWATLGLGTVLRRLGEHLDADVALRHAHAALRRCRDGRGTREAQRLLGGPVLSDGKEAPA